MKRWLLVSIASVGLAAAVAVAWGRFPQPGPALIEEVRQGRTPQTEIFNPDYIGAPPEAVTARSLR